MSGHLDSSTMLVRPDAFSFPTPPEQLFGREAPLVLEIGFGGGRFLRHLARERPQWNVLGAELSLSAVSRAYRRLRRAGAEHVRLYRGDAGFIVRDVLAPHALHRIYVNFPDPWPKERHYCHRLLQTNFFRLASTRLANGGALLLTTDHADYFQFALDEAEASGLFHIETAPPPEAALQTKYARKWLEQQKTILHAVFTKADEVDESFPPRLELWTPDKALAGPPRPLGERYRQRVASEILPDMHHALLEGTIPALDSFEKQVHDIDGGHVVFFDAFAAVDGKGFIVTGLVKEHDLRQDVLFEVRPAKEGIYVGVSRFGGPVTTKGTSAAVRHLVGWLQAQGLELVEELY